MLIYYKRIFIQEQISHCLIFKEKIFFSSEEFSKCPALTYIPLHGLRDEISRWSIQELFSVFLIPVDRGVLELRGSFSREEPGETIDGRKREREGVGKEKKIRWMLKNRD